MGRPPAEELRHRCAGFNARGDRCGSPAVHGAELCRAHLVGRAERAKLARTGDRLVALTEQALDRLERIIAHGTDEVAERAARTILDRTLPKPSSQSAITVTIPGMGTGADPTAGRPPSEVIAQRLRELEPLAEAVLEPDEILDAVLVEP